MIKLFDFVGQQAPGSIDMAFEHIPALSRWLVNGYPILSLVWNLALLLVPFYIIVFLEQYYRSTKFKKWFEKIVALILFAIWLLFMPNAAYIITDVRHLVDPYCAMSAYYRVCPNKAWAIIVFFAYGLIGWLGFVWLTRRMKLLLVKIWKKRVGLYFLILLMPILSLGVLLGLVERWNSWQLFLAPQVVAQSAVSYFTDITKFKNWLIFTLFFYLLYFIGDLLLVKKVKINK